MSLIFYQIKINACVYIIFMKPNHAKIKKRIIKMFSYLYGLFVVFKNEIKFQRLFMLSKYFDAK